MALAADVVTGPPAVVAAAALEAEYPTEAVTVRRDVGRTVRPVLPAEVAYVRRAHGRTERPNFPLPPRLPPSSVAAFSFLTSTSSPF